LLGRSDDERAIGLLKEIANGDNSAIQARALQRLFEIDPSIVDSLADRMVSSVDVNVRRWCARAMIAMHEVDRIEPLCKLLDDVNPTLRYEVSIALLDLGQNPQLRDTVTEHTMNVLKQDQWRGCEQAAVVLAKMDHKDSGPRLVELLGHERGEVQVATAWGLKQLKIAKLLPDILDHAQSVYDGFRSGQLNADMRGPALQMAHLFIGFGDQRYREADPLMRKYLPKDFSLGDHSRPAAAWALGMLYEDEPQEDLAAIMVKRLSDVRGPERESREMRRMCVVSLGRMKAESSLPALRRFGVGQETVARTCLWAIERMTGEPPPALEPAIREINDWFLAPLPPQTTVP
jgi:HEAT repeat protein